MVPGPLAPEGEVDGVGHHPPANDFVSEARGGIRPDDDRLRAVRRLRLPGTREIRQLDSCGILRAGGARYRDYREQEEDRWKLGHVTRITLVVPA